MKPVFACIAAALSLSAVVVGCAAETTSGEEDTASDEAAQRTKPICPVPEPARKGAPFTLLASGKAKLGNTGRLCTVDAQCTSGTCVRYAWDGTNGTCGGVPLTCADVACPRGFQCEVEASTKAVGCVEPRACIPAGQTGGQRRGGR